MRAIVRPLLLCVVPGIMASCVGIKHKDVTLPSGNYTISNSETVSKVYVKSDGDSIAIYPLGQEGKPVDWESNQTLTAQTFDVDVLTIPFKFRPSAKGFPRQLTTDFTGNLFLGYRADRYKNEAIQTPAGVERNLKHRAYTVGFFGGIGSTSVTPWTTTNKTTDEYNGFILSHGVSAMLAISNFTVGAGVGWDFLTDRDRDIWIYQNKPWIGLALSLNIN